uniref:dihydrolipoyllysine-residue succinyltransferase n=1 Tax=Auxenochlorella protothecoides TaxID=3075 RepID=A0A1D2AEM6_AUXPR
MVVSALGLSGRRGALAALRALGRSRPSQQTGAAACVWGLLRSDAAAFSSLHGVPSVGFSLRALPTTASWVPAVRCISSTPAAWKTVEVEVPSMGESITEGTVATILAQPGETVEEDSVLATLDTDKVSMDIKYPNKTPGVVKEYKAAEGDTVTVGQLFAVIEESEGGAAPAKKEEAPKEEAPKEEVPKKEAPKKEETKKEEPKKASPPPKKPEPASKPAAAPGGAPLSSGPRPERRVKMTRLRARVAERLKNAQNTYALLTTFNEVDMTALMDLRKAHKDAFLEKHGVKLGFMSAFVKAAANALETVPAVNAVIDGGDIIYRDYYDISVAVATPKGLVVPVLRNVDAMSFATVEKTINELGKKARDGALSIDEMAGGTFTISNGGVFGSMLSTPIINPPQSAILGMHATNMKPAVVDGQIVARPLMYLALTYDHRLIDGREAVTFLKRIKEVIEDPRRLLLDV